MRDGRRPHLKTCVSGWFAGVIGVGTVTARAPRSAWRVTTASRAAAAFQLPCHRTPSAHTAAPVDFSSMSRRHKCSSAYPRYICRHMHSPSRDENHPRPCTPQTSSRCHPLRKGIVSHTCPWSRCTWHQTHPTNAHQRLARPRIASGARDASSTPLALTPLDSSARDPRCELT